MPLFDALVLEKEGETIQAAVRQVAEEDLGEGEVLVNVRYSSLNYKDALAVTGKGKVIRGDYPFVPGIDLVGEVAASSVPAYEPGDAVIATGWGLGEETWGGFSQKQRVKASWLVPLPKDLSMKEAMTIGTAGLTAMLSVLSLEEHGVTPERGEVVVTGASGGAGSFAVALLAERGFQVTAATGSQEAHDYLRALGATRLIDRGELDEGPERPLERARWAGAVDAVGGKTLATLVSQTSLHGSIAAFGNAGGHMLNTTVYPFILRGVNLLGIDSNRCSVRRRQAAWDRLARDRPKKHMRKILRGVIPLASVPEQSRALLEGKGSGRVVVDVQA